MGRVRSGEGRARLPHDPRPLLPGNDARPVACRPSRRSSACSSPTGSGRSRSRPQARSRRRRLAGSEGAGRRAVEPRSEARAPPCRRRSDGQTRRTLADPVTLRAAGGGRLVVDGKTYRGSLRVVRAAKKLQLVNVVPLESYLLGVVPGEMPKDWPLEALESTGRRGADLCDREPRRRAELRPLLRRPEPALLRRERGVAGHDPRGRRDTGPGLELRRGAGRDVLLLVERRKDAERARRVRPGSPVPPLRGRPVGRDVAEPPLGDACARRPAARAPARPAGRGDRRLIRSGRAGRTGGPPRHDRAGGDERAAPLGRPQPTRAQVARVHARRAADRPPGRRDRDRQASCV